MTIEQLLMLEAIVKEGSMQKAARALHKSQPSLSVGIRKLEEEYGIRLFSPDSYRSVLTTEGRVFYRNAVRVLRSHRRLHKVASELGASAEPVIRFVVDPLVSLSRLKDLLKLAVEARDTTQITVYDDVLFGPMDALMSGDADFAIGHCSPDRTHEVLKKKLNQLELIPVVKKGLDFRKLPNIFVTKNLSTTDDAGKTEAATWMVSSHARKEELILSGVGWGRMSRERIESLSGVVEPVRSSRVSRVNLDIYLMVSRERPLGRVGRALWESVVV